MFLVERLADAKRLPLQFEVILYQYAIEDDRHVGGSFERTVSVECRRGPDDVIGLPFPWFAIGVHEESALPVNASGLAIDIGRVVVRIENLQFVPGIAGPGGSEQDAAIAARLTATGYVLGDSELDMQPVIPERSLGFNVADTRRLVDREHAVETTVVKTSSCEMKIGSATPQRA